MVETLEMISYGEASGPPLVIAHGLFGSARNWGVLAKRMAVERPVIAVDMRNHGESFRAETNSYTDMADDLARVIDAAGGVADVLGHSMGGKATMVLAATHPDMVRKAIIADIAPVEYAHSQSDKIAAMQAVDLGMVTRRSEAEEQLVDSVEDASLRAFLLQSLGFSDDGPYWKLNLDVLQKEMEAIIGFPVLESGFTKDTMFLTGGLSDYVGEQHHEMIHDLFPRAEFATIDGAGHWLHAEKPREFQNAVQEFLAR